MMKKIIVAFCFLSIIFHIKGETAATDTILTLEQCIGMALANNNKARAADNAVECASLLRKEAFTKYFPEISAAGMAFWANHDILQYNLLDIVELGLIKKGKMAGVQAMQPVFTGGRIFNGNKLAEVGEEVARLRREQTANELRLTTETLYWKLTTLKSTRLTLEAALTMLDTLEKNVKAAVDAGVVTRNDLLKVQLKRNSYFSELVDLDNGIKLVKMLLGQYVGLGTDGRIDIDCDVPEIIPEYPGAIYVDPGAALPLTADYNLLEKNVMAKELEKKMEIGRNLPAVAVGAGWYYHDLLEQNHNFGAVQIGVEIPLSGWWGGSYSIKRKSVELLNAKNEKESLSEELQIEISDKWNNLTASYRKMEIESEGIVQSKENLRLNSLYYEAGMTTLAELLEAETSYQEACGKYIEAYGNFRTDMAAYLIATGR